MVDSTNLPNVDINQIATDLNNKMDRDCLNYSDTGYNFMAGAGMPSDTYVDLTLGASGATYTAPANGWYYLRKRGNNNQYGNILNQTKDYGDERSTTSDNEVYNSFIPCTKNDVITITYNLSGNTEVFKFIYAQGAESEES